MTTKAYKYAGVSTVNGKTKIRFANDIMRIKVLDKNGHEGVNIQELPTEMQKGDAVKHLANISGFIALSLSSMRLSKASRRMFGFGFQRVWRRISQSSSVAGKSSDACQSPCSMQTTRMPAEARR